MDKLLKLIMNIQQEVSLSFSVCLSGDWIYGNGDGDKYPLKLKETYGFLAFPSPPKNDVLCLLKLLLEKEIDEYTEAFSLENGIVPFILGETSRIKGTTPKGSCLKVSYFSLNPNTWNKIKFYCKKLTKMKFIIYGPWKADFFFFFKTLKKKKSREVFMLLF